MTHKLSILLVEDEKNICDFISASLSAQDYRISTAHTGKEALPIITSQCPDLILLDLGLPDMDGMEIIRQGPHLVQHPDHRPLRPHAGTGKGTCARPWRG